MLNHLSARKAGCLSLVIMAIVVVFRVVWQSADLMAVHLPNPDSFMRLVLLRDHVPGGDFQFMARDNAPQGAWLHWSMVHSWVMWWLARGLAASGLAFESALVWAGTGLTMISLLALTGLLAGVMVIRGGRLAAIAVTVALLSSLPLQAYGAPLQLTHHVFMLVPLAAAFLCFQSTRWWADLAGGALMGLALWISPETMPLVVALAAMRMAMRLQCPQGRPVWPVAAGLLAMLAWGWMQDPPPPTFTAWALDHISLAWLVLGALLALWLVLADGVICRVPGLRTRVAVVCLAGLVCGVAWLLWVPGALAGPEGLLPDELKRLWWSRIMELKPATQSAYRGIGFLGMPVLAGVALLWVSWREALLWKAVWALTTLAYAVLAAWHLRMGAAAALAAVLAWGLVLCRLPTFRTEDVNALPARQQYRTGVLLVMPVLVAAAALTAALLDKTPSSARSGAARCPVSDVAPYLNQQPPGTVLVPLNEGPEMLWRTPHGIVASNYHHNIDGLLDYYRIQRSTDVNAGLADLLDRRRIRWLLACPGGGVTPEPGTLLARMEHGESIPGLAGPTQIGAWQVYVWPVSPPARP